MLDADEIFNRLKPSPTFSSDNAYILSLHRDEFFTSMAMRDVFRKNPSVETVALQVDNNSYSMAFQRYAFNLGD